MRAQMKVTLLVLMALVSVLVLTAWVYWAGLSGSFILDDGANIVAAHITDPDWYAVLYAVTHNGSGWLGRSVSMLSFVLTGLQYGLDPWGFKFHNLILHLVNGVLIFRLLHLLLPLFDRQLNARMTLLIAGGTAALWLLHPLLVSTVLYAVQRMTQLAAFFTLLAILAYVHGRLNLASRWRYLLFSWLMFPIFSLLAVLSKENGALIPLYILVVELFAFCTRPRTLRGDWRVALPVMCFAIIPLLLGCLILLLKFDSIADYSGRTFTLGERLLTEIHVVFFYAKLILLPRISAMSLFHDDFPIETTFDISTLAMLVLLCVILFVIWKARNRAAVLSFGLAWFVVSHLMESTIIPLELVFEHRNYLAAIGLLLPLVYVLMVQTLLPRLYLLLPVAVFGFAFMTSTRAAEWGNHELFTEVAIIEHPNSGRARNNYVNLLSARRDYAGAITQLEVLGKRDGDPGVYLHMLLLKCGMGTKDLDGLAVVEKLLGSEPVSVYALNSLQSLTSNVVEGNCKQYSLDEIEDLVVKALDYPMNRENIQNHAYLMRLHGIIAFAKGLYAQGFSWFMTAHDLTQDSASLHELLNYQINLGMVEDAAETLELVKKQNDARFGIDTWKVRQLHEKVEIAQTKKAP